MSQQNLHGFHPVIVLVQLCLIQSILVYGWCHTAVRLGEGGRAAPVQNNPHIKDGCLLGCLHHTAMSSP